METGCGATLRREESLPLGWPRTLHGVAEIQLRHCQRGQLDLAAAQVLHKVGQDAHAYNATCMSDARGLPAGEGKRG